MSIYISILFSVYSTNTTSPELLDHTQHVRVFSLLSEDDYPEYIPVCLQEWERVELMLLAEC